MKDNNKFEYSYTAPTSEERKYIESIRGQYAEKSPPTKLERLKELDRKVRNMSKAVAITVGICGTLIFGLGMSMFLEWEMTLWGAIAGAVGCLIAALAYPVYRLVAANLRKKYSAEILRLTDELLWEEGAKN